MAGVLAPGHTHNCLHYLSVYIYIIFSVGEEAEFWNVLCSEGDPWIASDYGTHFGRTLHFSEETVQ